MGCWSLSRLFPVKGHASGGATILGRRPIAERRTSIVESRTPNSTARRSALTAALTAILALAVHAQSDRALPAVPLDTFSADARAAIQPAFDAAIREPGDPARVGRLASVLHAWEQWETAHEVYERAQQLAPRAFAWHYLDGIVLQRLARFDEAAQRFRGALATDPTFLPAKVRLAEVLLEGGNPNDSAPLFEELAREPAVAPVAELGLGRLAARAGRHEEALVHLHRSVQLFPELGAAYYAMALTLRALGRVDEARDALAKHQQHGPKWPAIDDPVLLEVTALKNDGGRLLQRGIELADAGDIAGAIAAHERALAREPSLAQAHVNLISLYGRTKDWTTAEGHYRAVVALGVNLAEAHYNYGVLLAMQDRWQEAETAYRQALAVNPLHADARNNLGHLRERERLFDAAAREYGAALEARPSFRLARFNLGRMLIALKRFDEAIAELEPLRQPEDAETARYVFALATAHVHAGRRADGIKWAKEAKRIAAAHGQHDLVAAIDRDLTALSR
jgi:tetratricopeptide (TPR) repeat protein